MKKAFLFPPLIYKKNDNEYIYRLYKAINSLGYAISSNCFNKSGVLSLLLSTKRSYDLVYLNWYGISGQTGSKALFIECVHFIVFLTHKLKGTKIIFVIHNFKPHVGSLYFKGFHYLYYRFSDIILCHSDVIYEIIPVRFADKIHVINHPTRPDYLSLGVREFHHKDIDFLVWGAMKEYKGIKEVVLYFRDHFPDTRLALVGLCTDNKLKEWILDFTKGHKMVVDFLNISDQDIIQYHRRSRFVLFNYSPNSAIISAAVMYSLSLGSKVCMKKSVQYKSLSKLGIIMLYDDLMLIESDIDTFAWDESNLNMYVNHNGWDSYKDKIYSLIG
jgi:hypothetical protein